VAVNVGTAEIAVVPEMKNFGTQAASGVKGLTGQLSGIAGTLGIAVGATFAVSFGKEILTAANEAAESTNRLVAAATNDAAVDVSQLQRAFEDFGMAAAIDDENLKDLASSLLNMGFKGSTSELIDEVQAIEDLGAATGKSTSLIMRFFVALNTGNITKAITSAKTLGLVTQEQADAFTEATAAGHALKVQQELLAIATTKNHGAAEAQATDLDRLSNAWEELKESLGTELTANLTEVYEGLKQLYDIVKPLLDLLPDTTSGMEGIGGAVQGLADSLNPVFPKIRELYQGLTALLRPTDDNREAIELWAKKLVDGSGTLTQFRSDLRRAGLDQTSAEQDTLDLAYAMGRANMAAGLEGEAVSKLASAHAEAAQAAHQQKLAELSLAGGLSGLVADTQAVRDAQRDVNTTYADANSTTRQKVDADLALVDANLQLKADLQAYNQELKANGETSKQAYDDTIKLAQSFGLSKQQALDAFGAVRQYNDELDRVPSEVVTNVRTTFSHQQLASGGVALGGTTLVGERGPELVELPRGAYVTPNSELRRGRVRDVAMSNEPVHIIGELRIADWRNGIGMLDAELAWGDAPARTG